MHAHVQADGAEDVEAKPRTVGQAVRPPQDSADGTDGTGAAPAAWTKPSATATVLQQQGVGTSGGHYSAAALEGLVRLQAQMLGEERQRSDRLQEALLSLLKDQMREMAEIRREISQMQVQREEMLIRAFQAAVAMGGPSGGGGGASN